MPRSPVESITARSCGEPLLLRTVEPLLLATTAISSDGDSSPEVGRIVGFHWESRQRIPPMQPSSSMRLTVDQSPRGSKRETSFVSWQHFVWWRDQGSR